MVTLTAVVPLVGSLPLTILDSDPYQVLATFVAINSLIYATLAVFKVLPSANGVLGSSERNRRTQNRSIYPDAPACAVKDQLPSSSRERPATDF